MRSGELARTASVSTDTLRHYERLGLLPAPKRTGGNYRVYATEAIQRVRLIRNALSMGFSLKELSRIIKIRDNGGAPCREVRQMAEEKVAALGRQIDELATYREHLRQVLSDWDERLSRTGKSERARLLEALAEPPQRPALAMARRRSGNG